MKLSQQYMHPITFQLMLIGLISTYDYFLSTILGVILHDKSEIVFGMDNKYSYKELMNFSTLDEIRDSIIAAKIEDVIRLSHHAQFDWMEKRFGMELRKNLEIWPTFEKYVSEEIYSRTREG